MFVKVCCIGDLAEARLAVSAGAAAIGLVSEMPSGPGVIPDELIAEIAAAIPRPTESFLLTARREADAIDTAARLASALAAVDADLAAARDERTRLAGSSDAESLALYEQIRKRMSSAAVAELAKGSCAGCHTSISPKEQAEIKKVADTSEARCPYCGCLLVV